MWAPAATAVVDNDAVGDADDDMLYMSEFRTRTTRSTRLLSLIRELVIRECALAWDLY